MQSLVEGKTLGVTGNGGRGTAGAGPGRDPLTPRGAHQRPLLLLLQPQVTPRNAPKGITLPLRGITRRRGDWPGWPSLSWLQGSLSRSLMKSSEAVPRTP